jgi:hypothetical protein
MMSENYENQGKLPRQSNGWLGIGKFLGVKASEFQVSLPVYQPMHLIK